MALALNNLKRVDMPLSKETKPNQNYATRKYGAILHTNCLAYTLSNFTQGKKKDLERLEKDDIIEKVTKTTDWCSPIIPVRNMSGYA